MQRRPKSPQSVRRVFVLGEALVDLFVPRPGRTLVDAECFVPSVGGAPANVAVQLARLGVDVALWTAVGHDAFGERLKRALGAEGVDVGHMARVVGTKTGLTFVEVDKRGERVFTPRREQAAVDAIEPSMLPLFALTRGSILHHGTVLLRAPRSRATTRAVVRVARRQGAMVSLDVNLRPALFSSRERMLQLTTTALGHAHVVKATREEATALVGEHRDDMLIDALHARGAHLVCLTLDRKGALLSSRTARVRVSTPRVRILDATGAGDAFMGAALSALLELGVGVDDLAALDERMLHSVGARACTAGAHAVTALGATTGMLDKRALARALRKA
jgi:fructokinase